MLGVGSFTSLHMLLYAKEMTSASHIDGLCAGVDCLLLALLRDNKDPPLGDSFVTGRWGLMRYKTRAESSRA